MASGPPGTGLWLSLNPPSALGHGVSRAGRSSLAKRRIQTIGDATLPLSGFFQTPARPRMLQLKQGDPGPRSPVASPASRSCPWPFPEAPVPSEWPPAGPLASSQPPPQWNLPEAAPSQPSPGHPSCPPRERSVNSSITVTLRVRWLEEGGVRFLRATEELSSGGIPDSYTASIREYSPGMHQELVPRHGIEGWERDKVLAPWSPPST